MLHNKPNSEVILFIFRGMWMGYLPLYEISIGKLLMLDVGECFIYLYRIELW